MNWCILKYSVWKKRIIVVIDTNKKKALSLWNSSMSFFRYLLFGIDHQIPFWVCHQTNEQIFSLMARKFNTEYVLWLFLNDEVSLFFVYLTNYSCYIILIYRSNCCENRQTTYSLFYSDSCCRRFPHNK